MKTLLHRLCCPRLRLAALLAVTAVALPFRVTATVAITPAAQPLLPNNNGSATEGVSNFVALGASTCFMTGDSLTNQKLWKTDGSSSGTTLVKDLGVKGIPGTLVASTTLVYFTDGNGALWKSDGTSGNTVIVSGVAKVGEMVLDNSGNLFFTTNPNGPDKMWEYTGAGVLTKVVDSQYPPGGSPYFEGPRNLINVNGSIFFSEAISPGPYQLFRYNGSPGSITQITTQNYLSSIGQAPFTQAAIGTKLYFSATDYADSVNQFGAHLYVVNSDGSGMTTHGLTPNGVGVSSSTNPVLSGSTVYFVASTSSGNTQIWKTDGTTTGTAAVTNINPSASSGLNTQSLYAAGSNVFFDGVFSSAVGDELGAINTTSPSGALLRDIFPGTGSSSPAFFATVGTTTFFDVYISATDAALWQSDGTSGGTFQTALIDPVDNYGPFNLSTSNHSLFFASTTTALTKDSANNAVNLPMALVGVSKSQGDNQSAGVNGTFGTALQVHITNTDGSANQAGVAVTFVPPSSGASGSFASSTTVTTDSNGLATAPAFTANGTTGNYTVHVVLSGLDTGVSFSLTNTTAAAPNQAPSFAKGGDQTVLENASAQTVNGWASNLSAGPANESGQTLNFIVTDNNNALFSVQPAISATGVLTFTPALNANGSATVSAQIHDNGGTANGGVDTSATQTFTITVTAVNQAPSFTKGGNQSVLENATAQTVNGWATSLSAGPTNESGQALNFLVSNNNNGLFSIQPVISPSGVLTYTPAANANGSATVSVQLHDDGGTANGGVDTSATQTFTITVNAVNQRRALRKAPTRRCWKMRAGKPSTPGPPRFPPDRRMSRGRRSISS